MKKVVVSFRNLYNGQYLYLRYLAHTPHGVYNALQFGLKCFFLAVVCIFLKCSPQCFAQGMVCGGCSVSICYKNEKL